MSFRRRSSQPITWLILTNKTVQENTDKQTQYKSEKVDNLKYSRTKLPWFSCLLQHSARKRGGLILRRPRATRGLSQQNRSYRTRPRVRSVLGTRSCRHALCPAGRTARPACSLCTASTGSVSAASGHAIRCSRLWNRQHNNRRSAPLKLWPYGAIQICLLLLLLLLLLDIRLCFYVHCWPLVGQLKYKPPCKIRAVL